MSPNIITPSSTTELEDLLSTPPQDVVEMMQRVDGDIIFLGVGGKMGPTMARMALRATAEAGVKRRIIGVSRFSDAAVRQRLVEGGIETIACDLLNEEEVAALPDAPNVISMSGFKFGTQSAPHLTWATNCYAPALLCKRFCDSRIVAFSSGNVYGMVPIDGGGSQEGDPLKPSGEYSNAALGRERIYEYFSHTQQTPMVLLRLNYATELRYGVLVDIAKDVAAERNINVTMGYVNVIWLGDANAMSLRALEQCAVPAKIINLAGREIASTREISEQLGSLLQKPVTIAGVEANQAYLNNGVSGHELLGDPQMSLETMLRMTSEWIAGGGESLDKPTHFQVLDGKY